MNKPISTWTQTFFKLGYTLRRIWHDEPDYANNYTPLALEVLEDRQMLSGTGSDDPTGSGGPGQPANGIDGGSAAEVSQVVSANPGAGYSEQAALRLSEHWRANSNASYAWNQGPVLLSYFGAHASGTTTGVNYHAEVSEFDKDLGTYQISFYTYNYTITVSRSSNNGTGGMGGDFDQPSAANWYKEHLSVSVNGYTIESNNQLIAADFIDNGQFNNFNSATFKSVGTHSGSANYTFTGTIDPNVTNTYSRVDVALNEQFQQSYSYQTTVDSFWDRGSLPGNVTQAGTVQVSGSSQANRHTTFDSSKTSTGRNFNVSGNSSGSSTRVITYNNASLTITTAGYSPVDIANATEATMRTRNEDGTYVAPPTEGSRYQLTLNGTQTSTSNSNSNFSGNGSILPHGSNTVRTGIVNYSASASSTDTNDYVRTYTSDQTILGATIVYGFSLSGDGSLDVSRKIEKGGSQDIDVAVLHSHSHTIDKNRSEAELKYNLKHDYTSDGKVKQTTEFVNSPTGLALSYIRLRDDYNTDTTYRAVEQLQRNQPTSNSTDFNRTSGNVKLVGPSSQQTTFATTTISAQPGFAHETTSNGTVVVTGSNNLTRTATQTSISSFKSRTNESIMTSAAIELLRNSDGSVTAPPPMVGFGDGSLRSVNNSGSTRRLQDSISQQWSFAATGVVTLTDTSTYRAYTTQSTNDGDVQLNSNLDVADAPDGSGNSRSDAFESHIVNATTAGGLNGLSGRQEYWTTGAGATIAAAAVGEATVILQNLVITFTPRPTPPNNNEDEVQAVATGSSNGRKYDRTKSGTSTHIRIGDHTDAGTDVGFDRVSGRSLTMPSTAGETGTGATTSTYFDRDSWDKITGGRSSYSLTDVYSFSADGSFTIRTTGWSDDKANDTGNVGYQTALGSQSGNVGQGSALQAIAADGQTAATDTQWNALADQMNGDSFSGFGDDFSLSRLIDQRDSTETSNDGLRTEYDLTRTFTPKTFQVPVESTGGTGGTGGDSNTTAPDSGSGTTETRTVEGYEMTSFGSTNVIVTSSYTIQHNSGQTELLYARQKSGGTYQYVPGQGFGTGPNYRWLSNGRSTTDLASEGNSESYSSSTTVVTSYLSDGLITIQTIADIDSSTQMLATAKTTVSDRLWQDDYAAGHGRIAAARSSSLPPGGPNLSSSSNYNYDSDLTLTINPNLFPSTTTSSGSSGSSDTSNSNGSVSNYTPGSDSSTNPDGSGSSNPGGSSGPSLAQQYQNMQTGVSRWDASDKGFDLTGTVTEGSSSNFSHKEQLSQSSQDLMRMDGGRIVGAVKFNASSLEELCKRPPQALLTGFLFWAGLHCPASRKGTNYVRCQRACSAC